MVTTAGASNVNIPKWAGTYLISSDFDAVADAVRSAEKHTSAELVPMVVQKSATTGHVAVILFLLAIVVALMVRPYVLPLTSSQWVVDVLLFLFVLFVVQLGRLPVIVRLFTLETDLEAQVMRRAEVEFYRHKLYKTKETTGILIFVSLNERQVVVLADKGISDVLPASTWNSLCAQLIVRAGKKELGQGLVEAVIKCGELCASKFPPRANNPNELLDGLIILE